MVLPADWESIFSPARYKPMERLLDSRDYDFLGSQPGCNRRMMRRMRANRVGIFRGYARGLGRDFARVSNALKMLMVQAPVDRSSLAGLLLKQRLMFSVNMVSLEARLYLHSLGWSAPDVDVRDLLESLDALRSQLQALTTVAEPTLA